MRVRVRVRATGVITLQTCSDELGRWNDNYIITPHDANFNAHINAQVNRVGDTLLKKGNRQFRSNRHQVRIVTIVRVTERPVLQLGLVLPLGLG